MKSFSALTFILSLLTSVLAQQLITTTNAAGNTIVEQVTTNAFGQTVTQILQTLGGAATTTTAQTSPTLTTAAASTAATSPTTTAVATATTTQAQQGPVGQPGTTPTTPGGPTPFTYTTTDANGNPLLVTATFTPSFPATTPYTPTGSGTVLGYSQWLSIIGNNTSGLNQPVASQAPNSASRRGVKLGTLLGAISMAIMCVIGGSLAVSL